MTPFGTRLAHAIEERGRFCVGIDPHAALLQRVGPLRRRRRRWSGSR